MFASDPDPLSTYLDETTNLQRLSVQPGKFMSQVWEKSTFSLPSTRDYTDLWCLDLNPNVDDASDRLSAAGNSFVLLVAPGTMTTGMTIGAIELEFDITYFSPRLGPNALTDTSSVQIPLSYFLTAMGTAGDVPTGAVFNTLFQYVSANALTIGPAVGALATLIRMFFTWVDYGNAFELSRLGDKKTVPSRGRSVFGPALTETQGLGPGQYQMILEICQPTYTAATNGYDYVSFPPFFDGLGFPLYLGEAGTSGSTSYLDTEIVACASGEGFMKLSQINGQQYPNIIRLKMSYNITADRGYSDFGSYVRLLPTDTNGGFCPSSVGAGAIILYQVTNHADVRIVSFGVGGRPVEMSKLDTIPRDPPPSAGLKPAEERKTVVSRSESPPLGRRIHVDPEEDFHTVTPPVSVSRTKSFAPDTGPLPQPSLLTRQLGFPVAPPPAKR
jgi:hypothetical protein